MNSVARGHGWCCPCIHAAKFSEGFLVWVQAGCREWWSGSPAGWGRGSCAGAASPTSCWQEPLFFSSWWLFCFWKPCWFPFLRCSRWKCSWWTRNEKLVNLILMQSSPKNLLGISIWLGVLLLLQRPEGQLGHALFVLTSLRLLVVTMFAKCITNTSSQPMMEKACPAIWAGLAMWLFLMLVKMLFGCGHFVRLASRKRCDRDYDARWRHCQESHRRVTRARWKSLCQVKTHPAATRQRRRIANLDVGAVRSIGVAKKDMVRFSWPDDQMSSNDPTKCSRCFSEFGKVQKHACRPGFETSPKRLKRRLQVLQKHRMLTTKSCAKKILCHIAHTAILKWYPPGIILFGNVRLLLKVAQMHFRWSADAIRMASSYFFDGATLGTWMRRRRKFSGIWLRFVSPSWELATTNDGAMMLCRRTFAACNILS